MASLGGARAIAAATAGGGRPPVVARAGGAAVGCAQSPWPQVSSSQGSACSICSFTSDPKNDSSNPLPPSPRPVSRRRRPESGTTDAMRTRLGGIPNNATMLRTSVFGSKNSSTPTSSFTRIASIITGRVRMVSPPAVEPRVPQTTKYSLFSHATNMLVPGGSVAVGRVTVSKSYEDGCCCGTSTPCHETTSFCTGGQYEKVRGENMHGIF